MHRTLRLVVTALALAATASSLVGCSKQSEGQRCSRSNSDDDCDTAAGLVCTPGSQLGGQSDICCPPSGATNPACIPGALGVGGGSATSTTTTTTTSSTTSNAGGAGGHAGGAGTGGSTSAGGAGGAATTNDAGT